jgi:hypothetical protein
MMISATMCAIVAPESCSTCLFAAASCVSLATQAVVLSSHPGAGVSGV